MDINIDTIMKRIKKEINNLLFKHEKIDRDLKGLEKNKVVDEISAKKLKMKKLEIKDNILKKQSILKNTSDKNDIAV